MTVLDRSIPYEELLMTVSSVQQEKLDLQLPSGYTWIENPEDYRKPWASLMFSLGFFDCLPAALQAWDRMQQSYPDMIKDHFFLIEDSSHHLAAACALWPGRHIDGLQERLHYLGVSEEHQNQGLAGVLIRKTISEHQARSSKPLYLSTQLQSWPAVILYMKNGFIPYTGGSDDENSRKWHQAFLVLKSKVPDFFWNDQDVFK